MLLVDKITELVPMDYAVGVKSVTINEPFFRDISPATPSCLAPLSVKPWLRSAALFPVSRRKSGPHSHVYRHGQSPLPFPVRPGDQLVTKAVIKRS